MLTFLDIFWFTDESPDVLIFALEIDEQETQIQLEVNHGLLKWAIDLQSQKYSKIIVR